jgi:hypothetical protein
MGGIMAVYGHGLSVDRVIAFSDAKLVDQTFDLIGGIENDERADALYFVVGEMLERFAPEAALAELIRNDPLDSEQDDLLTSIDGLRRRQAARLLRDTLGSEDG